MQPIPLTALAGLVLGLAAAGCSITGTPEAGAPADPGAHPDHTAYEQHHDAGEQHHDGHESGHGAHGSGHRAALLTAADLPTGYRSGHAHQHAADTGSGPAVTAECEPLARVLGGHQSGAQHADHPQATAVFSKSHFGPSITETVVDYHGFKAAAAAINEVKAARDDCERYIHSSSRIGANIYDVEKLPVPEGSEPGVYLRLDAVGADFDGIRWDVWVHDCGGKLVAVTHRNAKGGDNADFWPAVEAAMAKQHPTS